MGEAIDTSDEANPSCGVQSQAVCADAPIDEPPLHIRFTDADWARVAAAWTAWWAGNLERPLIVLQSVDCDSEATLAAAPQFTVRLPVDMPATEVIDRYTRRLEATHYHGDAFPKWIPNFGPGIVAGFLGAQVHVAPDTVWFSPATEQPIGAIHLTCDSGNRWWRRVRELTAAAVARWGRSVAVGHTDLGGALDVLASLRGTQQLLFDLHDSPADVTRLMQEITPLWLHYYDELAGITQQARGGTTPWAPIWSPGRCYMLQSDISYMLSPRMFARFTLPDIEACCAALDHPFYHLDGAGQISHLDRLLAVERLAGIQWVPGAGAPPPDEWLPLLKRIHDRGKLCQISVSPQGAQSVIRELGGRGFVLYIRHTLTPAQAEAYMHDLVVEHGWLDLL